MSIGRGKPDAMRRLLMAYKGLVGVGTLAWSSYGTGAFVLGYGASMPGLTSAFVVGGMVGAAWGLFAGVGQGAPSDRVEASLGEDPACRQTRT